MQQFSQLDQKVQKVIEAGSIGTPVFVRLTVTTSQPLQFGQSSTGKDSSDANPGAGGLGLLALFVSVASRWMRQTVSRVYAKAYRGGSGASAVVHFDGGASALVDLFHSAEAEATASLILLGNRGAAYCDRFSCRSDDLDRNSEAAADTNPIRDALDRSARSGQPAQVRYQ